MTQNPKNSLNWALITGASSGIGRDLAKCFAGDGWSVILTARRLPELQKLAQELSNQFQVQTLCLAKDLNEPTAPGEIFQELQSKKLTVSALVNNAGFGHYGHFANTDITQELKLLQVNIVALTHLTKLFLKSMVAQSHGYILNVGSTAGFQAGPLMAVYYASKAYVVSFTEALANELQDSGVKVSALCPGPTETEFSQVAGLEGTNLFKKMHVMESFAVAKAGFDGLMEGKILVIPGLMNKLTVQSNRISPRKWVTRVVRGVQERNPS